jgi:polyferredoxin
MTRRLRIASQIVFFTAFVFFFFSFDRQGYAQHIRTQWFLQLNPLVAALASIASRSVVSVMIPGAVMLVIVTLLFGRLFCGFMCPLGAAVDFVDSAVIGKARNFSRRPPRYMRRIKFVLLIALVMLAVFGVLFPLFMDPILLITRVMALVVDPLVRIAGMSAKGFPAFLSGQPHAVMASFPGSIVMIIILAVLFAGGFWDRRFWCQYLCPSGAFFALLSRFPLLRRRSVSEKCNSCGACADRICPTRAISRKDVKITSTAECILCGDCSNIKNGCSVISLSKIDVKEMRGADLERRHLMAGIIGGTVALPIIRATAFDAPGRIELIRPPGAIPEDAFLTKCIACGECMKACPNHALGPCGLSDGLMRLSTPRLRPITGYCEPSCTACGYVCPTEAIRRVPTDNKPYTKIGTAIVDTSRCIAWRGERRCLVCMTQCPYNAITEHQLISGIDSSPSGPVVDKDACTGCGKCEFVCPVSTVPAISVQSYGERRVASGSFITPARKKKIDNIRKEAADGQADGE